MKISILATGTELTTGQTQNRNAAWISQKFKALGVEVRLQLTVPDDRKLIAQSLDFCALHSDVIFTTGGLGPTSDDFTRFVIADWLNVGLEFDLPSWEKITTRLKELNVEIKEMQKQQCQFPVGATVLNNSAGTANAFMCVHKRENKQLTIIALPGPPREIEPLWNDHLSSWAQEKTRHVDKIITHSFDTFGVPESDVASLVDQALVGIKSDFPLEVGYREHLPYVEAKLSYPYSVEYTAQAYVKKVELALGSKTILRNFETAGKILTDLIRESTFTFYDFVTQGHLHAALAPDLKKQRNWLWKQSEEAMDIDFFHEEKDFLALLPATGAAGLGAAGLGATGLGAGGLGAVRADIGSGENQFQLVFNFGGQSHAESLDIPFRFQKLNDRKWIYLAQLTLIRFIEQYRS